MIVLKKPLNRYFNRLVDLGDTFVKSSVNRRKIREEFHFLTTVPASLQEYYPLVSDLRETAESTSYKIVKIPALDASFSLLDPNDPHEDEVLGFLEEVRIYLMKVPVAVMGPQEVWSTIVENVLEKNLTRARDIALLAEQDVLDGICRSYGYESVSSYCQHLNRILHDSFKAENVSRLFYSHGDLCFSNMLYHQDQLYLIDPRGYEGDIQNTFRVIHYDLAKLSQSLLGNYDLINHELFEIRNDSIVFGHSHERRRSKDRFMAMAKDFQADFTLIRMLEASLFLSLIPYHKESSKKMRGFLINSLQILKSLE